MNAAQQPRPLSGIFPRQWKKITVVAIVELFLILIAVWTAYSPTILSAQSRSDISKSLFQFAKTTAVVIVSDAAGSYSFLFGMDHNSTFTSGARTIVEVFASLTTAQISSSFTKGISLQIDEARVLVDGTQDAGIQERVTNGKNVTIDYLSYVLTNVASGTHTLSVRLIVSIVDVNYIGYVLGNQFLVTLNGTFSLV